MNSCDHMYAIMLNDKLTVSLVVTHTNKSHTSYLNLESTTLLSYKYDILSGINIFGRISHLKSGMLRWSHKQTLLSEKLFSSVSFL